MNNPILSIIIPSYNTSKYVDECLPSYIYKPLFGSIKIILIDDGATDDTVQKIQKYTKLYPNLFYFFHKNNGGHGSVINFGVHNLVDTKYFKIIDGDDWVNPGELKKLCDYLQYCDDDVVLSKYSCVFPNKTVIMDERKKNYHGNNYYGANLTIHSVTYKTSLFVNNKIFVREKVFYEDNEYRLFPLIYSKNISYTNFNVYNYRLGNPNQSVSLESIKKHFNDIVLVYEDLLTFYANFENNFASDKKNLIETIMASIIYFRQILLVFKNNKIAKEKLLELDSKIRKHHSLYIAIKKYSSFNKFLMMSRYSFLSFFRKRA